MSGETLSVITFEQPNQFQPRVFANQATPTSGSAGDRLNTTADAFRSEIRATKVHGYRSTPYDWLKAHTHQARQEELKQYLENLLRESECDADISSRAVELSWDVWKRIACVVEGQLEVPDCCPGEADNVLFCWDTGVHYLECEVFSDGRVEWFYKNRETGEYGGDDRTATNPVSTRLLDRLLVFSL